MIRQLCRMGHPILRQEAAEIEPKEIISPEFQELIHDMWESMEHYGGIGIAAPQLGVSKKVAVIRLESGNRYEQVLEKSELVIINPSITVIDEAHQGFWEGCLSVPGLRGYVERPQKIKINFLDEQAQAKELEASGFLATVIQHELDHLFGLLYVDKLSDTRLLSFNEEFEQFIVPTSEEDE